MSATVVRYKTKPEFADENAALVEKVYVELNATQPPGFHYATFRLADGVTFVHVATREGDDNPLASSAAFAEFQSGIAERCAEPPVASDATVVGSYGVFD